MLSVMSGGYYDSFADLQKYAEGLGVNLRGSNEISSLAKPVDIDGRTAPNRLFIQPVEGADAEVCGAPGELTKRRYLRFALGGAGLIWFEAAALLLELKSNANQLVLTGETLGEFGRLIDNMKEAALKRNGKEPVTVLQMSHPGRSCLGSAKPASDRDVRDRIRPSNRQKAVSDSEIERLGAVYGDVTGLAKKAGFDGVEVKACHNFFISELLSARDRPGKYGGCFENRVRHLKESVEASRAEADGMFLAVRLNFYDGIPYPDGFGMKEGGGFMPDGSEPLRLIAELSDIGVGLINCTSNDPEHGLFSDVKENNDPLFSPPSCPFKTGARMHMFASKIKLEVPKIKVAATAFSHLRQHAPPVAAGMIERNEADLIGFGRQALAYPDFARDIILSGGLDREKVCVNCGGCNRLIGDGKNAGCIVRDEHYRKSII